MRIARVEEGDGFGWAAIVAEGAVDLGPLVGREYGAIHKLLGREGLAALADYARGR